MFVPMKSCSIFVAVLVFGFCAAVGNAAVLRVPADFATIQGAIIAAAHGDIVQVAAGTYVENIDFLGKAIQVRSEQGPEVTIIDGNRSGPVVKLTSGESRLSLLNGFTIQNGFAFELSQRGGGIRIENSSPTITGNVITSNWAFNGGAGISSTFGSPLIQGNKITNNSSYGTGGPYGPATVGGGGVSIVGASSAQLLNNIIEYNWWGGSGGGVSLFAAGTPTIQDNVIAQNFASSYGGGISIVNQSDATIIQNLIVGNSACGFGCGSGGGVYWFVPLGSRGPFLINNTIARNSADLGSGVFADGYDYQARIINNIITATAGQNAVYCGHYPDALGKPGPPTFLSNDVVLPSGVAYGSGCRNQTGVNGNISSDPLFQNPIFQFPSLGDYHVQTGSPTIDAGASVEALLTDLDGAVRPQDGDGDGVFAYDMGAYEAPTIDRIPPVTTATVSPVPNSAGWNNTNITVSLNGTDNPGGFGVRSISYWLTGAQAGPTVTGDNPALVPIATEGTTTVYYSATDNAGNVETPKTLDVRIDKTNPVISGMPAPGCTLWPANHKLARVATVSAVDSLSGLASLMVTATSNEPDSGAGDIIIDGGAVQLRADRSPSGNGRIYTITAIATDFADNSVTATATCTVGK